MAIRSDTKVLLVSAIDAPFVHDDIDSLRRHFDVRVQIGHGFRAITKIIFGVLSADVIVCWFASVYAFVAVLVGKIVGVKSVVMVGGVDAAKDEQLGYGIWLSPWRSKLVRYAFRHADRVLVVDPCLKEEAIRLAEYDGKNIWYLPFGFDSTFWRPIGVKELFVLTVAVARSDVTLRRKGLDTLVATAKRLPGVSFVVVGTDPSFGATLNPPLNVEFHPAIPREDLLPFYQRAKVYCQPSRREGLPNALCEAMLCGCIPIATNVSGNPTAVGDAGVLIPPGDVDALAQSVIRSLAMDDRIGQQARTRIVSLFPKEKRESELTRIVGELTQ